MAASPVEPHDLEAEESVLGGMMLRGDVIEEVMPLLQAEDFYYHHHGETTTHACSLRAASFCTDTASSRVRSP